MFREAELFDSSLLVVGIAWWHATLGRRNGYLLCSRRSAKCAMIVDRDFEFQKFLLKHEHSQKYHPPFNSWLSLSPCLYKESLGLVQRWLQSAIPHA